jgi:hypothetical protein
MVAVGQERNAAELGRNLQKLEHLHSIAPTGRKETIRSLLQYEKELGVHGQNNDDTDPQRPRRLKDPSGAMGLLWIRRTLAFQERLYTHILENTNVPSHKAALQAYQETLEPYHGWALQQVYSLALKTTTPSRQEMLQKLCTPTTTTVPPSHQQQQHWGPLQEEETAQDLRKLCDTWRPVSIY